MLIGFSTENIDQDGYPCREYSGWKASCFQVFGFFIYVGEVYWDGGDQR